MSESIKTTDFEPFLAVPNDSHAVVIGGGMAGLLAARVLTNYFERVTLIERDRFPDIPEPRQGIPQSYHPHVLLARGQQILEQLFPGIKEELISNGASALDWTADFRWFLKGRWAPRFISGITSVACTRNLLEARVRQRLVKHPAIRFLEGRQVVNLLTNRDNTAIRGIRLRNSTAEETEILATLVVDTSGRGSNAPKWLQNLGFAAPQETTVKSFLGYATRWYQTLSHHHRDYKILYLMPQAPDHGRGAVIHRVEGDRWLVNLIGIGRDYPPLDEVGFLNFARDMCSLEVYDAIKAAEPISPVYGYRRTENRWRHYEKLSRFPENFVVLGDAACAFNPVYGQGITIAALGAIALDECLLQHQVKKSLTGFSRRFQKKLAKVNIIPWLMATGDDFRWPTTEGGQPDLMTRLKQRYLDRVMTVASENAEVYQVLAQVFNFIKPPTALFSPKILAQVLMPNIRLKNAFKLWPALQLTVNSKP